MKLLPSVPWQPPLTQEAEKASHNAETSSGTVIDGLARAAHNPHIEVAAVDMELGLTRSIPTHTGLLAMLNWPAQPGP